MRRIASKKLRPQDLRRHNARKMLSQAQPEQESEAVKMLVGKQGQLNHTENKMQLRPDWMYRTECRTLADSQICRALPDW